MFNEKEILQFENASLQQWLLRVVADNEPIKKYAIPQLIPVKFSKNEVFDGIAAARDDGFLDVGDIDDGFFVMLTPEGRQRYRALLEERGGDTVNPVSGTDNPEKAGTVPDGSPGEPLPKKSVMMRLVDFVILHPGASRDAVKKAFPEELRALSVAFCDGRRTGRLESRNEGTETWHPGPNALATASDIRNAVKSSRKVGPVVSHDGKRLDRGTQEKAKPAHPIPEKMPAAVTPVAEEVVNDKPLHFMVARTSDSTIMLFGLQSDPVELDQEQTRILSEFILTRC